jgi:hypothetical protein
MTETPTKPETEVRNGTMLEYYIPSKGDALTDAKALVGMEAEVDALTKKVTAAGGTYRMRPIKRHVEKVAKMIPAAAPSQSAPDVAPLFDPGPSATNLPNNPGPMPQLASRDPVHVSGATARRLHESHAEKVA